MNQDNNDKPESLLSGFWMRLLVALIIAVAIALTLVIAVRYA